MPDIDTDSDPTDIAIFVLPGGVGLGFGVFLGLALDEFGVAVVLGVVGLLVGHAVGYALLKRR